MYCLAAIFGSFSVGGSVIDSITSKVVDANELIRTFSLASIYHQFSGLIYAPLFNIVYQKTVEHTPEATYYLGAAFGVAALALFM